PVAVGFGLGTADRAAAAAVPGADGVIVGTRLVRAAAEAEDPAAATGALVGEFSEALRTQPLG
ncbi:MAG: tryptophan synthase subunit alpha, partial [Solirubrobacteraceae bacterium]